MNKNTTDITLSAYFNDIVIGYYEDEDLVKQFGRQLGFDVDMDTFMAVSFQYPSDMNVKPEDREKLTNAANAIIALSDINKKIGGKQIITCDSGLPAETLLGILNLFGDQQPVFVDPVSCAYAAKIKPFVGKFHTIKPNRMEAEILSGVEIRNDDDLKRACSVILEKGVQRIFVSLGGDGCFYMDQQGRMLHRKLKPLDQMVNATGGGDAFMAAVIYSYLHDFDIDQTLDYALAAGLAAISHERTINPYISVDMLEKILKERK